MKQVLENGSCNSQQIFIKPVSALSPTAVSSRLIDTGVKGMTFRNVDN